MSYESESQEIQRDAQKKSAERQAAVIVVLVLLGGAFFFFVVMDFDVEAHRSGRKITRVEEDLAMAQNTLLAMRSGLDELPSPTIAGTLPLELSDYYAKARGGQPYWQEKGRLARLDVFSPGTPYREAFFYGILGDRWIIASRGPDEDQDVTTETLTLVEDGEALKALRYDPSNGTLSSGDLWVMGEAP